MQMRSYLPSLAFKSTIILSLTQICLLSSSISWRVSWCKVFSALQLRSFTAAALSEALEATRLRMLREILLNSRCPFCQRFSEVMTRWPSIFWPMTR
ncbi:hypothetical protein EYF80_000335 [Liparis tanakae]|uniref:Uncharacterized protein n=1 Tax=Liparis tanakae TaxID=230148 RepID=A0A4Z2JKE0_9TELE|nr:hypothetical protein EYF80_000335 [Liparis tanakae]